MTKRVFLIVLDSVGVGELPDADLFGDVGANTMKSISKSKYFNIDTLISLGFSQIDGLAYLGKAPEKLGAAVGKCAESSMGKDTTTGHWEIAGVISEAPMPTFPNGFPKELLDKLSEKTGRGWLCNKPYSGTEVIKDYGKEHLETGALIIYTSADSVFQIAAHESIVPPEKLYEYCRMARELLTGEYGVGRVIARPFDTDESGNFYRTANRHDFSLEPTGKTILDAVKESGKDVVAVGKISDIFAHRGITKKIFTHGNAEGMQVTLSELSDDFRGLCFVNLVDFDMQYGHRNDVDGYAKAVAEFDAWLPSFTAKMRSDDVLIITADHGCDPGDVSTDHTREYIPLVVYGKNVKPANLGIRKSYSDIAATVADILGVDFESSGESFAKEIGF